MQAESSLSIIVIEDDRRTCEAVNLLFNGTAGYRCIAAFSGMGEALADQWKEVPDAVLIDLGLPEMNGIEGIRHLRQRYPDCAILAFTVFEDDDRLFAALRAGACGYLLKKTPPAKLIESVREAVSGGAPMSPQLARKVVSFFQASRAQEEAIDTLTPHELKILKLLVDGHSYRSAGKELNVTVDAISFHVKRIYSKLHVHSKGEAVARALRNGIVS